MQCIYIHPSLLHFIQLRIQAKQGLNLSIMFQSFLCHSYILYFLKCRVGPLFPLAEFCHSQPLYGANVKLGPSQEGKRRTLMISVHPLMQFLMYHGCAIPKVLSLSSMEAETMPNSSSNMSCPSVHNLTTLGCPNQCVLILWLIPYLQYLQSQRC